MPMDLAPSERAAALRDDLLAFMDSHVYPAEPVYERQIEEGGDPHKLPPVVEELKAEARRRGLWNLFLPDERWGAGLSNLEYAHLAEVTGRSPHIAPESLNCGAPDTGNMEVLAMFGTPEQQERWLVPLLEGEIRSCFAMTEPAVASSRRDATSRARSGARATSTSSTRASGSSPAPPTSAARSRSCSAARIRTGRATRSTRSCSSRWTRPA